MHGETAQVSGWLIDGFFAWVALWIWVGSMLLHGLWRSFSRPEPDPIRSSGPIEP